MNPLERPSTSYRIVCVASGCTLVLELVAGRVLAPFVAVAIQTGAGTVVGRIYAAVGRLPAASPARSSQDSS